MKQKLTPIAFDKTMELSAIFDISSYCFEFFIPINIFFKLLFSLLWFPNIYTISIL